MNTSTELVDTIDHNQNTITYYEYYKKIYAISKYWHELSKSV